MPIWVVRVADWVVALAVVGGLAAWGYHEWRPDPPPRVWAVAFRDCPDELTWIDAEPHLTEAAAVLLPADDFDEFIRCPTDFWHTPVPPGVHVLKGSADFVRHQEWLRQGRPHLHCPPPGQIVDGEPDYTMTLALLGSRAYVTDFPGVGCLGQ